MKNAHRVSGRDLQIRHEKLELYRLSIGFGSAPRRFGGEPASIPIRVEEFFGAPAGPVLDLVQIIIMVS